MTEFVWLRKEVVLAFHHEQLAEHGGLEGLRDEGLLESALSRPINLVAYDDCDDLAHLAAAYAFGIARNHPFVDGNKRTALVAAELFLELNAQALMASDADCLMTFLALADGTLSEEDLAHWIRANIRGND